MFTISTDGLFSIHNLRNFFCRILNTEQAVIFQIKWFFFFRINNSFRIEYAKITENTISSVGDSLKLSKTINLRDKNNKLYEMCFWNNTYLLRA